MLSGVEDHPGATQPPQAMEAPAHEERRGAPRHLLDIDDLSRDEIITLLDRAEELRRIQPKPPLPLQGKVVGLFFFQPSTRTRLGFHAAAARLGATAIELTTTKFEPGMSAAETPLDTFRSVASYCDLIVLRHRDQDEFHRMVSHSPVNVINGGCGTTSHPTQTLGDLLSIRSHFSRIEGLRIGITGDLAESRAAKSLLKALRHFPPKELRLMAPEGRGLTPADNLLHCSKLSHQLSSRELDVLYMAGFPKKTGCDQVDPRRCPYALTLEEASHLSEPSIILSPLPRIDEIDTQVDKLPQASYFNQSKNTQLARTAALELYRRTS